MIKINLDKDSDWCFSSYHSGGIIQTRNSGMMCLTDEARDEVNRFIVVLVNQGKVKKK